MEIVVKPRVSKKMRKFPKFVQEKISEALQELESFPNVQLDILKIGALGSWRARIGEYRIFFITNKKLVVWRIEKREKAYV